MSQSKDNSTEPSASGTSTAAERHLRRRTTQLPAKDSPVHTRIPRLFSNYGARSSTDSRDDSRGGEESEEEEDGNGDFLARATSYSRLMHAHTKGQLDRPGVATLPSYTRTMHVFTLNQLNHMENSFGTTKSETSSPHIGAKMTALPRVSAELGRMTLEEEPQGTLNTPEAPLRAPINDLAVAIPVPTQAQRKRSVTEPAPREYMAPKAIDVAATATLVS